MWHLILALAAGVPIGLQLGATGTGGGLLAIPLLVYIVGTTVGQAAAISLVIVASSALIGTWAYARAGQVKYKATLAFSWAGVAGAWGGAYGHQLIRPEVLLILFGLLLLIARILIIRDNKSMAVASVMEESCVIQFPRICWIKMAGIGLGVGMLNGFFGVGGGFMIVAALVLMLKFPGRLAVGTSLSIIAVISLGGIAGHLQFGQLDSTLTVTTFIGSAIGTYLGAHLADFVAAQTLNRYVATITVSVAFILIIVNTAKLVGLTP